MNNIMIFSQNDIEHKKHMFIPTTIRDMKHTFRTRHFLNIFDMTNRNCGSCFVFCYYYNIESRRDAKRSGDANYHP